MKIPDVFIIVPCTKGFTYYIRPYDIVNIREGDSTRVCYKQGGEELYFITLLTAKEIHERIIELEEANFKYTFGE
jgi:hypothetical protein